MYSDDTSAQAETLKYLFLIFSDDTVVPLDKHVLTTEVRSPFPSLPHQLPVTLSHRLTFYPSSISSINLLHPLRFLLDG